MWDWRRAELNYAFPRTVPIMVGYLFLGAAYGILMNVNGYGIGWTAAISIFVYAGSLQYLGVTMLAAAVYPVTALVMSLMLNARHLFYGLSMLPRYRGMGRVRNALVFLLCDETFSINCAAEPPAGIPAKDFYLAVSLLDYLYWVTASFVGGLIGGMLHADLTGLDFVLTALIFVLFLDRWDRREDRPSALIGLGAAVACLAVFGQDSFIIPAMGVILAALLLGRNRLCR